MGYFGRREETTVADASGLDMANAYWLMRDNE